jgi:exosortase A-associated hydrolase 1
MRRLITFPCAGETLVGTLDDAPSATGLLIVSGGNEVRMGAHRGTAMLAARVAEAGRPVFRFDRRGIGDSTGDNRGFESSAEDIAAAAATFRAEMGVTRIVAFGNCDAATALALFHADAGIDGLLLANPWTIDQPDDMPPAAAIRARYADKLRDPREWLRAARGGVDIGKFVKGLSKLSQNESEPVLAARLHAALASAQVPVRILLATGDNTAIAFRAAWSDLPSVPLVERDTASHSFASIEDKDWLFNQVMAAVQS